MKKLLIIAFVLIGGIAFSQEGVTLNRSTTLVIEEVPPTWPGCEGSISQKDLCFKKKLITHIITDFKFPPDYQKGSRIIVDMVVNAEGKPEITSVEGGTQGMREEVRRKILSMPQVKPGHSGGTPKPRKYKLPLSFK